MRRNWFRNRLGRKNNRSHRQGHLWKSRSAARAFSGALERLEDRRLLSSASLTSGVLNIVGDNNQNDFYNLQVDPVLFAGFFQQIDVSVTNNSGTTSFGPFLTAEISQINVQSVGNGNNTLTVDSSNGLITPPIQYFGASGGLNYLDLIQPNSATVQTSETFGVVQNVGQGFVSITGTGTQTVLYQNVTKIIDEVPVSNVLVQATNGDNAINFTNATFTGPSATGYGISIDGQPIYFFFDKTNVTIDAGAGDDTVNINAPSASTTTDLLSSITVEGNDPTASDTLIVNGTSGQDDIDYRPSSTIGSGEVDVNSEPSVSFSGIESVVIDGQGGNDNLTYTSPSNGGAGNVLTFTPGDVVDSATVTGRQYAGGALVPLTYQNIGALGTLTFSSVDEGRNDYLDVYGTAAADLFDLDPDDGGSLNIYKLDVPNNVSIAVEIDTPSISTLTLHGLDGDDQFNVVCMENNQVALPYDNLIIDGGNPSASDIVDLTNPSSPVIVNLGNTALSTDTQIMGYGGTITLQGDEVVNFGLDLQTLTVNGTSQPENITYTPTDTAAGTFTVAGLNTVFNFSNISDGAGAFAINPGGGTDTVTVNGTSGDDDIVVTGGTTTVVQVNSLQALSLDSVSSDTESLVIEGGTGDDNLEVDSTNGPVTIPVTYDGGPGTNSLTLVGGTANSDVYTPGSQLGSGTDALDFGAPGKELINFMNLAPIYDTVAGPLTVYGTNADNAINYTSATVISNIISHIFVNNPPIFAQVSVDSYEPIVFTNKTSLTINALAGDDTINLNNPTTPTNLTGITVNGGDPTASDTLIVNGTANIDTIDYDPTTIGAGSVTVNSLPAVTFNTIESVVIDGQGGGDMLHVVTPSGGNYITYTPGAAPDSGTIAITTSLGVGTSLVPLTFQHIGTSGIVTFNTNSDSPEDILTVYGTAASDNFELIGNTGELINSFSVGIATPGIDDLNLKGLDGDDVFLIYGPQPFEFLGIDGGNPSASDIVSLQSAPGDVTADFGDTTGSTPAAEVDGYGSTIDLTGVEVVNMDVNGHKLNILGVGNQPNAITYTPTGAAAGTVTDAGHNLVYNFTNVSSAAGAFTIDPGAGGSNTVTVNGTQAADSFNVTRSGTNTIVTLNGTLAATLVSADTASLVIDGFDGNDMLTVDTSNGPIFPTITFDGGTGLDTALMTGSGDASTYTPGPLPGAGTDTLFVNGSGTTILNFVNTELLDDDATTQLPFEIIGTGGNDAINYSLGGSFNDHASSGLVSVNNLTPIQFVNKTTLEIDSGAGDDTINLNNTSTTAPTDLTGITVNGGDPTASDTLIFNGTSGDDTISYNPSATIGMGTVQVNIQPLVTFSLIEQLKIDGQGGNDALGITTPTGGNTIDYTPGTAPDSGVIAVTVASTDTALVPLTFQHIGTGGSVTFANLGGRTDLLELDGTNNDDTFSVDSTAVVQITNSTTGLVTDTLNTGGIAQLDLRGLEGDDTFNIAGNTPLPGLSAGPAIVVEGGDPSASDVLNFTASGTTANPLLANLRSDGTITEATFGAVAFSGIEVLNVNANGHSLMINCSTGPDSLAVTPLSSNSATVQDYTGGTAQNGQGGTLATMTPIGPVLNATMVSTAAGGFTVNGISGSDQLFVEGTQSADTIDVNDGASGANAVKVNGFLVVNYNSTMPHVEIDALAGSDTINIAPSATTTFLVDGGDPIGVLPGDVINLIHPAAAYQLFPGPTKDSGGLNTAGFATISWVHIETIINSGGGTPIITGTNGDDIITIIARDSSYNPANPGVPNPLLDGIQDFTVSVNDGPDILFVNTPNLLVDALAGNDQIHVQEPAPNHAVWDTQIFVAGGTPSAGTGNVGDLLELETPGTQSVTYAPDEQSSAIPAVGGVVFGTPSPVDSAQFNDTTDTSKITATTFSIAGFYQSSPGGVEQFVYQGDNAGDTLTYLSPANSSNGSTLTYTPGATADAGTINGQLGAGSPLVPLVFQGIGGVNGGITFNSTDAGRHDVLNLNGTSAGDLFDVGGLGSDKVIEFTNTPSETTTTPTLTTTSIDSLQLFGLGGPDVFGLNGGLPYRLTEIQGSDPIMNLSGATGPVTVNLGNNALSTNTTIMGYGGTVVLVGIDTANLDANAQTVTVNGTTQPESFVYTPTGSVAGTITDSGINTVFNFSNVSSATTAFTINPDGGADTVTVNGTSSGDGIRIGHFGTNTRVQVNSFMMVTLPTAATENLVIASGAGDDTLTVDATNGPVLIPVVYDGGTGRDTLVLTGGTATTDTYTPGPTPGSGNSTIVFTSGGGGTQVVNFQNLEPVQDDVTATTATVNADNAANAINYGPGPGFNDHINTGLVTVDNQETYEFTNKTHLVINALNGSDEINMQPAMPTALTDITVNGGDPTASDTLIVNGTSGNDTINYSPSATIGSGTVQVNALPTIIFNTIEGLTIDGQGGNDALTVTTPAGGNFVTYTPGTAPDSGTIAVNGVGGGTARVPLTFQHIGALGSSITFATAGVGRTDTLQLYGTNNSDTFNVNQTADIVQVLSQVGFVTDPLHTGSITALDLFGLNGDDTFNIAGALPYTNGVIVDAGDPSASDTVNLSGATGAVAVNLANPTAATFTTITGYGATVTLIGTEVANLNTNTFALTANGNQSPNLFTYTPTGTAAGTFTEANINTVFNFSNTAGIFTINGSVGSTADQVTLEGSASRDLISIDQGARTASVTNVANTLLKTVTLGPNIQVLTAQGLSGQDTFLVTPALGTQFPLSLVNPVANTNNLLINVDGGGSSSGENNALVIATQAGAVLPNSDFVVVNRGAEANSGTVRTFGPPATPGPNVQYPDINYVNVQTVSPFVGTDQNAGTFFNQPNLLILGPDLNEPNQNPVNGSPFNATFLGSGPTINVNNAAIFPNSTEYPFVPADQDYYRVVAQNTGTLDFQVYFNLYDSTLFPGGGNLNIQVLDVNGNVIATGTPASFGSVGTTANARIRIPVVQGETYYLRVFGSNADGSQNTSVVNGYNFTIINTAAPTPGTIELSESVPNGEPNAPLTTQGTPGTGQLPSNAPPSDSGRSQFDNVTNGGFTSTTTAAAAAAAGTSGTLPAPAGATLGKPTIYITLDDSFLLQDIPGNQTPGGVPGTAAIPINFNSSTTLVPTFSNAPINGVAFNGNYRIAVYDDGNGAMSQQPGTSNNPSTGHTLPGGGGDSTFIGFAEPVPAVDPVTGLPIPGQFVPHLYMLIIGSQGGPTGNGTGALASDTLDDGVHNITARVQIIEPQASTNPIKTAFGARSPSLQITIDTVAPPVQFGFDANQHGAITPGSDSGVVTEPETSTDLVTNVTAPTFQGLAEANSIIYLYAAITNPANPNYSPNPVFPQNFVSIGETVAIPLDGTNAYPDGQWTLTSTLDLNDPLYFTRDGLRTIVVQAEDLAGNKSPDMPFSPLDIIQIEIDTQGPQVTDVVISDPTIAPSGTTGENLSYNLFSEKFGTNSQQQAQGPTPLVYAITINLQDLPVREAQFLAELAFKPEVVEGQEIDDSGEFADGGITLIGDANGRIAFTVVANPLDSPPDPNLPNTTPGAATGEVQLRFKDANGNPIALPDDRYTLTINDTAIVDPAGNKLDGESDAAEPLNNPNFPSGNGVPGGNFTARFTVDSRPELGDFAAAQVYIDTNGNFIYDPQNTDFTNRDLTFTMQVDPDLAGIAQLGVHDSVFVGKFAAPGSVLPPTGYFSKLAAYGVDPIAGPGFRWLIDTDGDGLADMYVPQSTGFTLLDQNGNPVTFTGVGIAIAGEFDGNTADGDEVGLFDGSHFFLDTNHDFKIDAGDTVITTQLRGFPIVGDFNGDGTVDLGTWQTDVFQFNFGVTGTGGNSGIPAAFSGNKDATINFGFPGVGEIPLAADMDGDGITDIGLWVPGHGGTVPEASAEEYFLLSNDFNTVTGLPNNTGLTDPNAAFQLLNHPFDTFPLGHDLYANLLDEYATPIVGNFDPPLAPSAAAVSSVDPAVLAADITPPTSTVSALPATENTASFSVSWSGQDDSGGSGVASYDIYVSDNGGRFAPWLTNTTSASATFNGVNGHTYGFMSVATDNADNVQNTPTGAQATTKVQLQTSISTTTTLKSSIASITAGQSVTFTATVSAASGSTPTGSVAFKDGSTTLATVTLSGGLATYTNTTFTAASHSITAMYNPIAPDVGSVSAALIESVTNPTAPPPTGQTFSGTSGNDIFTISPANATGSVTVSISNTATKNKATVLGTFVPTGAIVINGLAGNDTLQISTATIGGKVISVTAPISFSGGDGTDTLIGANVANVWNITGANSGTLNNVTFDTVENLTGGASTDAFAFSSAGSLAGKINGGSGANTLDYSAYGNPAVVNLGAATASGTAGFAMIQHIVGSSGSTLVGLNANSAWNITGAGMGTVGTFSFTGMTNLTGGSAADTFTLTNGAGVSGKIDGGGGTDTLKYTYTSAVTVNLAALTATGTGSIANLESFTGGSNTSDTLIGPNSANTWTVSTANTGKLNAVIFSGFENLSGGSLNDNFVLGRAIGVSGHIDGGAGLNMLDYAAYTTAINVNLATGTATNVAMGVSNIAVVRGGSGNDTIQADDGNDVLIGGAGNDTLTAGAGRDLLFGGLGADTLNAGSGEDILISGTTKFDSNLTTIDNLLAYWSNSSLSYSSRVTALKAGSVTGVPALTAANIVNDTSANTLNGGSGLDWFFAKLSGNPKDSINSFTGSEQEN